MPFYRDDLSELHERLIDFTSRCAITMELPETENLSARTFGYRLSNEFGDHFSPERLVNGSQELIVVLDDTTSQQCFNLASLFTLASIADLSKLQAAKESQPYINDEDLLYCHGVVLAFLRRFKELRDDLDEDYTIQVVGTHLDNTCSGGGFIEVRAIEGGNQELVVVANFTFRAFTTYKFNLATLIALARLADTSKL